MLTRAIHHDYNWYGGSDKKGEPCGVAGGSENPFINPAQGDFNLIATSSPLDGGRNLGSTYALDLNAVERPAAGNWDMGAYEQSASSGTISGDGTDAPDQFGAETPQSPLESPSPLTQVQEPQLLSPSNGQSQVDLPVILAWEAWTDESSTLEQMILIGTRPDLANADTLQATSSDEEPKDTAQTAAGALGGLVTMASLLALPLGARRKGTVLSLLLLGGVVAVTGCGINDLDHHQESVSAVALHKQVTDLQPGTTYYWQAITKGDGEEVSSVVHSFTVAQ
jgi:hypothetical protein